MESDVKRQLHTHPIVATLLVAVASLTPVAADLPTCPDKPWDRCFAGTESRKFRFTMDPWALGRIAPFGKSGKEISGSLQPTVSFIIEEIQPGGKTVVKQIVTDSLETQSKPIAKQGKTSFKGKVTGEASFEGQVEFDKGTILLGGRLLDPGTLTKHPLRFGIRVTFPTAYKSTSKEDKENSRDFAKKVKGDRYAVVWTDGKQARFNGTDKVDPEAKAVNGPGIAQFRVDADAYQGNSFEFKAGPNSKMLLSSRQEQPFHEGFSIIWYPDPAKDPETKARLTLDVK